MAIRIRPHSSICALVLCGSAFAQSDTPSDNQLANQLNPQGSTLNLWPWTQLGLNPIVPNGSRSPSGLHYQEPQQRIELEPLGDGSWQAASILDIGVLGSSGTTDTASFLQYADLSPGVLAGGKFEMTKPATGIYLSGVAGSIGRDDQFYRFSIGKSRSYDLTATFQSIPHVLSTNARVLWDGAGSNNLTLPSSVTPGDADSVRQFLMATDDSILRVNREKTDLSFSIQTNKTTRIFARASTEVRDGSRPSGGTFAYSFLGQVAETVNPIDYRTNELLAGLSYSGTEFQLNIAYTGSIFNNTHTDLRWDNPGLTPFPVPFVPPAGQLALAPDNSYHNLRADLAGPLPFWQGRFSSSLSWSMMRQDDDLLAPTISTGQLQSGASTIDLNQWNNTEALSRTSAEAEREFLLGQLKLILRPLNKLRLTAQLRLRDEDNKTDYIAQNPLTGQLGYVALDGGLAAAFPTSSAIYDPALPGSRIRYRSMPFEKDTLLAMLLADLRLSARTRMAFGIERERYDYVARERTRVLDDRYRASVVQRGNGWGTLRASYEYTDRHGDNYQFNPYEPFYTSSLADYTSPLPEGSPPHTLSAMRKLDLSSHSQHAMDIGLILIAGDKTDISLSARAVRRDYTAEFGVRNTNEAAFNAEWAFRISRSSTVSAFYSYQEQQRDIANIANVPGLGTDPDPAGEVYPLDNAWSETVKENNHFLGASFNYANPKVSFDARYTFLSSRNQLDYNFASEGAFLGLYTAAEAGTGFPEQVFDNHILEGSLNLRLRPETILRFFARWESETIDDFRYAGLTDPVVANTVFLGAAPEDFDAWVFGSSIRIGF